MARAQVGQASKLTYICAPFVARGVRTALLGPGVSLALSQFIRQRSLVLSTETLERAAVGQRDMHRSVLHVLTDIFTVGAGARARAGKSPGGLLSPAPTMRTARAIPQAAGGVVVVVCVCGGKGVPAVDVSEDMRSPQQRRLRGVGHEPAAVFTAARIDRGRSVGRCVALHEARVGGGGRKRRRRQVDPGYGPGRQKEASAPWEGVPVPRQPAIETERPLAPGAVLAGG